MMDLHVVALVTELSMYVSVTYETVMMDLHVVALVTESSMYVNVTLSIQITMFA